jgi:DNA-binding NarL/FixJ family response regulator
MIGNKEHEPVPESDLQSAVTRVLIVDDHSLFSELLAFALDGEPDFECLGTAEDAVQAVALVQRLRPEMVVMDIQLGRESGLDAIRQIKAVLPGVVAVVVSAHRDPKWVVRASQAGANAFAPKTGSLAEILHVLRRASNGTLIVAPSLFAGGCTTTPRSRAHPTFTDRENEVLTLMGHGIGAGEIARVLGISVHTCRGYVKTIHSKLDVRSQLEAVVKAQRLGLIETADVRR